MATEKSRHLDGIMEELCPGAKIVHTLRIAYFVSYLVIISFRVVCSGAKLVYNLCPFPT